VSGWVVPANQASAMQLPAGLQVASMGRRVGAWILDRFVGGLVSSLAVLLAIVTGAVSLNSQALDQIKQIDPEAYRPFSTITAPLLNVNTGLLIAAVVFYVVLSALYYAGCWVKFGGSPCQRALHLQVADMSSGRNLSLVQALLRWALLEGISVIVGAAFLIVLMDDIAATPTNQWLGTDVYGSGFGLGAFGGLTLLSDVVSWGSFIWLIVLIVSAGTHAAHRGLHDRIAGSIVLGPGQAIAAWPGYPYPAQGSPYWPAQGGPAYPYPPQAWPGYPPQGPAVPPQGGPAYPYPPQAWPGYPPQGPAAPPQAWPGYPPQPGYPPAASPQTPPAEPQAEPPAGSPPASPPDSAAG